ncbi:phosphatidylinositol kinase-related protein kinase tor1 [Batrachochytrium dendrobatidis]|nr:phosphatidylinositol kinase-related protein kinase tor1 [Batrachochytrium dendrobatidis]
MATNELSRLFLDLKIKTEDSRVKAANELRDLVSATSREITGEAFAKFNNELYKRIFELVASPENTDKFAGVIAIERLIDLESGDENTSKISRFANYLHNVLPGTDPQITILATKALGRLVNPIKGLSTDFVEAEIKRAFEWLQGERIETRRYAAVLILKELTANAPSIVYSFVPQILDLIWAALRDPKINIRESAAEALSECLTLVQARETQYKRQTYKSIFEECQRGFKMVSADALHGSLLALREILTHTTKFMDGGRYNDVCETIMRFKEHKDLMIRKTVISVISNIAQFDPDQFVEKHLAISMSYLLLQLKKEKERSIAFISVGKVAIAIGRSVAPYLDAVLSCIREALAVKVKSRIQIDSSPFQCIGMLAIAVGPALTKHMHELLDCMFVSGLTEPLCQALIDISCHIPPLLPTIQARLLDAFTAILCNRSTQVGAFQTRMIVPGTVRETMPLEVRDNEAIKLALTTLGSFDLNYSTMQDLVLECADTYLEDDNIDIRKAAAVACCQILVRHPLRHQSTNSSATLVNKLLERMIAVGITDPEPSIRHIVLSSFDESLDHLLAKSDYARSLLVALNDEVFVIRETVISKVGRLALYNPSFVMPKLRNFLIKLLTELEYAASSRQKEESAQLLAFLFGSTQRLVEPYVEPILKVLLSKARDASPGVASKVLTAIGELAYLGCEELAPYLDDLMAIILETLQDQSSFSKREAAIRTLSRIISRTGWVIEPFIKYPNLLNYLIAILKSEQSPPIRRETVKVIGVLGALDPYRHKLASRHTDTAAAASAYLTMATHISPSSDEYFPTIATIALMKILRDPSLSIHHAAVVNAVMIMFRTLGLKCVSLLPQIMPPLLAVMKACPPSVLDTYFQNLGALVSIVKLNMQSYIGDIIALIQEYWNVSVNIQNAALSLVEQITLALEEDFKVYLPTLLPQLLQIFDTDNSEKRQTSSRLLSTLAYCGQILEEYLHLVIPTVIRVIERLDHPVFFRKQAIQLIVCLARKLTLHDQCSRLIHPLIRVLKSSSAELHSVSIDALCRIAHQMQEDFVIFIPVITKVLAQSHIRNYQFEAIVSKLLHNELLSDNDSLDTDEGFSDPTPIEMPVEVSTKKLPFNQQQLRKAWEVSQRSTKDDWNEWIRRFGVELLKESPSHALRACASLAGSYPVLARELFNPAFVSCWGELYDQFQDELVKSLETALTSPNIPPETLQTLLNLAEFMEHDDKALPIDIRTLGLYAAKCHAYAKALHYKELEFISEPLTNTIEALISINNQLQQPDSAIGVLTHAQQNHNVELKESWYEKLNRWEDGLAAYERKQAEDPNSVEALLGRMRCLHNLGRWEALAELSQERWSSSRSDVKKAMSSLAAAAAWGVGQWDVMDEYISMMKQDSHDSVFFRAILALHRNLYPQALGYIEKTRDLLDAELPAIVSESYTRAYNTVVRIQMLAELEEIIMYKQAYDQPDIQAFIRKTWMARIKGCKCNVEVWQRILKVRTLVVAPKDDVEIWIKFASLCRKSGRLSLSCKSLSILLTEPSKDLKTMSFVNDHPAVVYASLKHMWAAGDREQAYLHMKEFSKVLSEKHGILIESSGGNTVCINDKSTLEQNGLQSRLARCYLKLGDWTLALKEELTESIIPEILDSYFAATQCDKNWYKAWHAWALANFEVLAYQEKIHDQIPNNVLIAHAVPSVQGFFRSIALSTGSSLQDTLRLLTLWFKYGFNNDVNIAVGEGFGTVSVDTWLDVIPQLIARIHATSSNVRRLIHQLLSDVGKEHPQALVYSLTVASKSQGDARQKSALAILDKMRVHSDNLVEQALLVSQELIRVAILWPEMWHEGLEDASRLYFGEQNVEGMIANLQPLHLMLERGPETFREVAFMQAYGRDLAEAFEWSKKYKRTLHSDDLNQAWDLYYQVFKKVSKLLPQLNSLEMQYVSPKLLKAQDFDLAVPGSYRSGDPIVRIGSFLPTLTVMASKQRPRRINIRGSDGKEYQYLLKGHEDLRQDERVMQLFGLVNTLLNVDAETYKRHLVIHRYPVIPLSPNSGLIGWVPHCDTLHSLIRDYRESRKILLNIEQRLMLQMAPDYDNLSLLKKVEVFDYALENTTGQDLYKVLWLKSKNSEVWLDRRTNYTRSLAVMSMVGYILGLGDRHPSNLMLDRFTGKVIHIDFGDCFEVAIHRDKFPERIPFRLTRMLIHAMEVSGIEGTFRITCENVMRVLRENKDSLMAVLEAFVYDPLINWRLMTHTSPKQDGKHGRQHKLDHELAEGDRETSNATNNRKLPRGRNENEDHSVDSEFINKPEGMNARALTVISRVSNKLTGRDFKPTVTLDVPLQVQKLILQATSFENLCQCYAGWCASW